MGIRARTSCNNHGKDSECPRYVQIKAATNIKQPVLSIVYSLAEQGKGNPILSYPLGFVSRFGKNHKITDIFVKFLVSNYVRVYSPGYSSN